MIDEAGLDALIERQASGRDKTNELATIWRESERKHRERERAEHRAASWLGFHEHMSELHEGPAAEHAPATASPARGRGP
jgi:hypothetical protein